ncbi:MAG: hypothetical protein H7196_02510 [candidate division SR1 bacterium]|nr:hypothetical protein [candidate division SR1 bacterium]
MITSLLQKIKPIGEVDTVFLKKLESIDLEPIMCRMVKGKHYLWSIEKAVHIAELFKCFLYLVHKYPTAAIVPTFEVDDFWHEYLGDNAKYNLETTDLFGSILIHFGYYGMRGEADSKLRDKSYEITLSLFEEQFGNAQLFLGKAAECSPVCIYDFNISNQSRMSQNGISLIRPTLASL